MVSTVTAPTSNLDGSLLRGIAWTGATKWLAQVVTWTGTLVLARLLSPADYGLVGMAYLFLGLMAILTEFGLAAVVVTHQDLTLRELGEINGLAAGLGALGAVTAWAAAYPIGLFFDDARLPLILVGLSAAFMLATLRTVPEALLRRDLRFRALGTLEALQAVLSTIVIILAALAGLAHWALVLGPVVAQAVATLITARLRPCGFRVPTRRLLRLFRFSRDVLVERLSWYAYENSDFLVAGRRLGPAALGAYSLAWTIASVPVSRVAGLVARVTPSFFSRLQNDPPALRRLLVNTTEGLALVTLPSSLGLAVVADDLVPLFLGPKWNAVTAPLRLLAVCATLRCVATLFPQVLVALRDTRFLMLTGLAMALLLPPSFLVASAWGATGIAAVWLCVYPLLVVPLAWRTFRLTGLRPGEYVAALWPAVQGSAPMLLAVLLTKYLTPPSLPTWIRLAMQIGTGLVVFGLVGILPNRERFRALIRLFRGASPAAALPPTDTVEHQPPS